MQFFSSFLKQLENSGGREWRRNFVQRMNHGPTGENSRRALFTIVSLLSSLKSLRNLSRSEFRPNTPSFRVPDASQKETARRHPRIDRTSYRYFNSLTRKSKVCSIQERRAAKGPYSAGTGLARRSRSQQEKIHWKLAGTESQPLRPPENKRLS